MLVTDVGDDVTNITVTILVDALQSSHSLFLDSIKEKFDRLASGKIY